MSKEKIHTVYKTNDGQRVPSVTTALGILAKNALIDWAWKCGVDGLDYKVVRDSAADVGTLAHYMILCHLRNEKPDTSEYSAKDIDLAENCLLSYFEWQKHHTMESIFVETPLVSETLRYGGTIDWYGKLDGEPTLIDHKTGKAIYGEFFYQLAAYKHLLQENGYPCNSVRILRIGKSEDEGFEERVITSTTNQFELFKHCLVIYELQKIIKREEK
jgi:hypothetical protein